MSKKLIPGIDYIAITTPFYCTDGKGKLLLHKRSNKCRDEQGKWDPGGGQLEFGETPEDSVLREVMEEYGCSGKILEQIPPISIFRELNGQSTHWLAIPFIIKVDPNHVTIKEPEKVDEFGWFELGNLPQPLHSAFKKDILETNRRKILERYIKKP